ncbi:DegT/DnrJ/EryC1/StrS family aminotransferase [Enterocloster asparagiformis]|uniref:DegT/DnrJ/EryC1/StrS aminotransferase family protein n=3 Tax=Enterocloster TaxID=2719313 RepID=C0CVQ4_9FIRM|nr:DegT/DnrJ/EryC1/StrS family aminotransferase [Enterocloster asparagiformis]EEG56865.1 DegT/DnrJ/EryC1/StrS aminotransferase family protein [[Clostridium] asparagiforme DSM 15981]RGX25134.1 DegT/DnrJ/EryC1/StrS family aminotransferase [Enterocloster asparagiformis]UWO75991.1 DegT/DnrJ/EryC1/StrS family aminotransferase [[Clostridium] asparagiforme DSM 15981]
MEFKLCDNPWGNEEIAAIEKVIRSNMYTMGQEVRKYEEDFAKRFGTKYAIMVSSGSTANLLAIAALVYSHRLPRGSEVIVPAVSWSTTYAPLEQFGMKVVFVDIDKETLNIDLNSLRRNITNKTKMILLVNLLGNPNDFDVIRDMCKGKDIIIMEDNCESLGAKYNDKQAGTFGIVGTYSSFYSHHICTMEGGTVVTDDDQLYEYMLAVRAHGWTRNLPDNSTIYEKRSDPFYESFNFIIPGFNIRPLEMEGAIGQEQLKKMDGMIKQRRKNAEYFKNRMQKFEDIRIQKEIGESSWFGFALLLQGKLLGQRDKIVHALRENGIETRPIVAGNFTRNKVIEYMDYSIPEKLVNADDIHFNGFFIGNHSSNNNKEIDYFIKVLDEAIKQ